VNDPAAMSFSAVRVRVAKSLKGLTVNVVQESLSFYILISEGFDRAFVDSDAPTTGSTATTALTRAAAPSVRPQIRRRSWSRCTGFLWASRMCCGGRGDVHPTGSPPAPAGIELLGRNGHGVFSFEAIDQTGAATRRGRHSSCRRHWSAATARATPTC